jgi:hypothetical protein
MASAIWRIERPAASSSRMRSRGAASSPRRSSARRPRVVARRGAAPAEGLAAEDDGAGAELAEGVTELDAVGQAALARGGMASGDEARGDDAQVEKRTPRAGAVRRGGAA